MAQKADVAKREIRLFELQDEINDLSSDISVTYETGLQSQTDLDAVPGFKVRSARIESTFEKFLRCVTEAKGLAQAANQTELLNKFDTIRNVARERYYHILMRHESVHFDAQEHSRLSSPPASTSHIKLPAITLPSFSGNISTWASFKDTYESLIHRNDNLTDSEKFHYLKSALKGTALHSISAIPVAAENYGQAWEILKKKYDNTRIQAIHYLMKIFNYRPLQKANLATLEEFSDNVLESAIAFRNLNLTDPGGFILYTFCLKLLDPGTRGRFEMDWGGKPEVPTFDDFSKFMQSLSLKLQTETLVSVSSQEKSQSHPKNVRHVLLSQNTNSNLCPKCSEKHRLFRCPRFHSLSPQRRYEFVKAQKCCINCLLIGHTAKGCPSTSSCTLCHKQHHTLLHFPPRCDEAASSSSPKPPRAPSTLDPTRKNLPNRSVTESINEGSGDVMHSPDTVLTTSVHQHSSVLLGTAWARIKDNAGRYHPVRLLLDSGSQRSFITQACADRLSLEKQVNFDSLKGFGDAPISGGDLQACCTLAPKLNLSHTITVRAVIIAKITDQVPVSPVPSAIIDEFKRLPLADETFGKPGKVDFLLGADAFCQILKGKVMTYRMGLPSAIQTIFGWVLMGSTHLKRSCNTATSLVSTTTSPLDDLKGLVGKFWEIETVTSQTPLNPEEVTVEQHFAETHSRQGDGRYMVRLPFKRNFSPSLESSYNLAFSRFRKLEHKLDRNRDLKTDYLKVLADYLELGYISKAVAPGKYYLPHHCVLKENASTRVRIVFDASAPTDVGSLNHSLLAGPKLQLDIRHVLVNFRRFKYAITADVCQMYLQILIHPEDRIYQHFVSRQNSSEAITDYELNRVSFGMASSPYLALRVIKQLIQDEGSSYPLASHVLNTSTYIDDVLAGADTLDEAARIQEELIELLKKGGFALKKWASNSPDLLETVAVECGETREIDPQAIPSIKILGLQWNPIEDCLSYNIRDLPVILTKRGILSSVARMYDPLGYLAPVILKAKHFIQLLWSLHLDWDDPIPSPLGLTITNFFAHLMKLRTIQLPRCFFPQSPKSTTIIGFSDASSIAYAAAIYLRVQTMTQTSTHLLISKTRLAPLKPLTVPRLELCGAGLLVELWNFMSEFFNTLSDAKVYFLSDSSVVLHWLKLPPHTLKVFVANRVTKILELTNTHDWYHVSSEDNAADLATRGLDPLELVDNRKWWKGPDWLEQPPETWPISNRFNLIGELPEVRTTVTTLVAQNEESFLEPLVETVSSYLKLIRIVAYVGRFSRNVAGPRANRTVGPLTMSETRQAEEILIKAVQKRTFMGKPNSAKSLLSLNPFVDSREILRVGGRLRNSPLSLEAKHPILLPSKARLTHLLIDYYHSTFMHAGPQLTMSLIRRKYWILGARDIIRQRINRCIVCHRFRVQHYTPLMGDLPLSRFEQGRAFIAVGVDFAGPFEVRESHRRKAAKSKAYLCLFVCLGTKATHLELVSNLTTEAFIATLNRFIARRGLPSRIFSDHGTNFIGADRHLRELYQWFKDPATQQGLLSHLHSRKVLWEFIPPAAPHFGGVWEAGVKSCKYHLTRVMKDRVLTYEELATLLCRIEAILNSRPLYPLSSSPEEYDVLTPGHFLIGAPLVSAPEPDWKDVPDGRLSRWQLLDKCVQDIWNRWKRDYLNSLQQRVQWITRTENIKPNALVLLRDPATTPLHWPTGRIVEVYPGADGVVRVVKVRTTKGEYIRPVIKLAPLLPTDL